MTADRGAENARDVRDARATVQALLAAHGETYAMEAGIRLRDTPQPLYQLLVLAMLLSARIRTPTAGATWQRRRDVLDEGGYRRYDERTATRLGDAAQLLLDRYDGDLRKARAAADGDAERLCRLLREVPGIGPVGAGVFLREVQAVWPEFAPAFDGKVLQGAQRLELPGTAGEPAELVPEGEEAVLAAALVRAAVDRKIAGKVLASML
ncbi:endonuclease [Streptomyces sp. NBC_00510]